DKSRRLVSDRDRAGALFITLDRSHGLKAVERHVRPAGGENLLKYPAEAGLPVRSCREGGLFDLDVCEFDRASDSVDQGACTKINCAESRVARPCRQD